MTNHLPDGIRFTNDPEADRLIRSNPLAFLLGLLLDQQMPSRRAWAGPYALATRLDHLNIREIADMPPARLAAVCAEKPAIHRFPKTMAGRIQKLCQAILEKYGGEPTRIWKEASDAHDLRRRLEALPGLGPLKARAGTAILIHAFGVDLPGKDAYPLACEL